jgi:hypothetical protein
MRKIIFELAIANYTLYKHPRACTNLLEIYRVSEHVIMNLVPLCKISVSLMLRLGKTVCVLGISTTPHTLLGITSVQLKMGSAPKR